MITAQLKRARALARFVLFNAAHFDWSLQGMGMLRLHLEPNTRLHIWHPEFAVPGVSMIHDHLQWGLTSYIVAGRIANARYIETAGDDPGLINAGKKYMHVRLRAGYGAKFLEEPRPIYLRALDPELYAPGAEYSQAPAEIHETIADPGTITIMTKTPTADGESARVFWPFGAEWGSAEPRRATPEEVAAITTAGLKALGTTTEENHHAQS